MTLSFPRLSRLLALLACVLTVQAQSPRPEFIRPQVFSVGRFAFAIRPVANEWMTLEVSADLRRWTEQAGIKTSEPHSMVYLDETMNEADRRFYRLKAPGTGLAEVRDRWRKQRPARYEFRLRESAWRLPGGWTRTGLVSVNEDQKTISELEYLLGPTSDQEPPELPSIDELFDFLESVEPMAKIIIVRYDTVFGHPSSCWVYKSDGADIEYEISDFAPLEGKRHAAKQRKKPPGITGKVDRTAWSSDLKQSKNDATDSRDGHQAAAGRLVQRQPGFWAGRVAR